MIPTPRGSRRIGHLSCYRSSDSHETRVNNILSEFRLARDSGRLPATTNMGHKYATTYVTEDHIQILQALVV